MTTKANAAAIVTLLALTVVAPATAAVAEPPAFSGDATETTTATGNIPPDEAGDPAVEADPSSDESPVGNDDGGDESGDPPADSSGDGETDTEAETERDEGETEGDEEDKGVESEPQEPPEDQGGASDTENDVGETDQQATDGSDGSEGTFEESVDGERDSDDETADGAEESTEESPDEAEESADEVADVADTSTEPTGGSEESTEGSDESAGESVGGQSAEDSASGAEESTEEPADETEEPAGEADGSVEESVDGFHDASEESTEEAGEATDDVEETAAEPSSGPETPTGAASPTDFAPEADAETTETDAAESETESVAREGTSTVVRVAGETESNIRTVETVANGADWAVPGAGAAAGEHVGSTGSTVTGTLERTGDTVDGLNGETTDEVVRTGTGTVDGVIGLETDRLDRTVESAVDQPPWAIDARDASVPRGQSVEPVAGTLSGTATPAVGPLDGSPVAVDETVSSGWSPIRSRDPYVEVPAWLGRPNAGPVTRPAGMVGGAGVEPADSVDALDGTAGVAVSTDDLTVAPPPGAGPQEPTHPDDSVYADDASGHPQDGLSVDRSVGDEPPDEPRQVASYLGIRGGFGLASTSGHDGEPPAPVAPAAALTLGAVAVSAALARSGGTVAEFLVRAPGTLRFQARTAARSVGGWLHRLPRGLPVPGYSRYDDSDPLENEQRARLYEAVAASPGENVASLVDGTSVSRSSARYHLRILEHEGLVTPVKIWGKRRFFPAGTDEVELRAALLDDSTRTVLEALGRHEPASGATLTEALDRDPSTVSHHLQRLSERGLVDRERHGRAVINRLTPAARAAIGPSGRGGSDPRAASSTD